MPRSLNGQFRSSAALDLSILPTNVFSLRGDAFYSLVEELTSDDIEELLRIQKISNPRCFMNTNPLAFFDINSDDPSVLQLQRRLSFKGIDKNNIVLAGVRGYIRYLQELFGSLLMKKMNKRNDPNSSSATNTLLNQISSPTVQTLALSIDSSTTTDLSTIDHHSFLDKKIQDWWEKNRDQFDVENHMLTEPDDYQIIISDNSVIIKCCCNKKINIPMIKGRKHYQLSNFYKHLTQNDQCTAIKRKRTGTEHDSDDESIASLSSPQSSNQPSQYHGKTTIKQSQQSMKLNKNASHSISSNKRQRTS